MTSIDPKKKRIINQYIKTEKSFGVDSLPPDYLHKLYQSLNLKAESSKDGIDDSWSTLQNQAATCKECVLCTSRQNVVFGEGNKNADLMFIGEAPGHDEDLQGKPFVGKAGQLLTKIIEALGLKRTDVFIANCLKCRPPGNRNPLPDEIAACNPILRDQIKLIKPKVICALGKFAAQTLLASEVPISKMRGKFFDYDGIKLMPTFHPAYLLRNPGDKRLVWNDMKLIAKELGIAIPSNKKKA